MSACREDCVWTATSQRLVMVPTAIVGMYDEPFREAAEGEPQTPAWREDNICLVHEATGFSWVPVSQDRLAAVESAIELGCDLGCHCRCHEEEHSGV